MTSAWRNVRGQGRPGDRRDLYYSQDNLRAERIDGETNDAATARATLRRIKAFAALQPTVILPAHDPDAPRRLREREAF